MDNPQAKLNPEAEALIRRIKDRAGNLYTSRQMLCAEAVAVALNRGLNGGLSDAQAAAMAAPFSVALGESGCLCGALSGAVLASGLLLGKAQPHRRRNRMRQFSRQLHDSFKATNGATCCRVLSKPVKHDRKRHFRHCAELTANAAEMAARLVLRESPGLAIRADHRSLAKRQSVIGGALWRLVHLFSR